MKNNTEVKIIEIEQNTPGFNSFFGSWVCKDDLNILIDTGPANSAHNLLDSLIALGFKRIDYILLTHIHIDHCGSVAKIIDHYPMAKVICHNKGIKHLVDPSDLWEGSLNVLGKIAYNYGKPEHVAIDAILPHTENHIDGLKILETPGHAIHHLSFSYKWNLFPGEAAGNFFIIKGAEYMRPATPPKFFFDICMRSVDQLIALDNQPIHYVHCGMAMNSHVMLKRFKNQLFLWKDIIKSRLYESESDIVERCVNALIDQDPNLRAFNKMDKDTKNRERFFLKNSVKGFLGFLKNSLKS